VNGSPLKKERQAEKSKWMLLDECASLKSTNKKWGNSGSDWPFTSASLVSINKYIK